MGDVQVVVESARVAQRESAMPPIPRPVTPSGIAVPEVLTARDVEARPDERPGEYPFTRGVHPDGYRGRLWTIRQYAGFGTAEESNRRFKQLLRQGQTGLSVAFDLPTQCGLDPVDPMACAEVGRAGVSLSNLSEAELLFEGIDLGSISTSFTINGTAAIIYAMYVALADREGVARSKLTGTLQNDILKEFAVRGTWIFPVQPSLRLVSDVVLYSTEHTPRFNPISISGGHFHEAGATSVEEQAFMLANALTYVEDLVRRGGDVKSFAQRLSFLSCIHMEFFEEICKLRASRRIWASLIRDRYGVSDPRAQRFRVYTSTGGITLTAGQPLNNIVRVAYEAMAAALGGAQAIFTMAYDEAYQLPTEASAEIALRTQQILAYETGIAKTVDPLGGSYYVEWLTDRIEAEVRREMAQIEAYGGMIKAIETGWLQQRVTKRALERKQRIDSGDAVIVGENWFRDDGQTSDVADVFRIDDGSKQRILDRYEKLKQTRDTAKVTRCLERLQQAAGEGSENLVPYLIDCCHAGATVGEIADRLRGVWGSFNEPVRL